MKLKLPEEIKTKWLTALRSGRYKQTRKRLYQPVTDGYCCLGVLAEELEPGSTKDDGALDGCLSLCVKTRAKEFARKHGVYDVLDQNSDSDARKHAIAIEERLYGDTMGTPENILMSLNDHGVPFTKIADFIEKEL